MRGHRMWIWMFFALVPAGIWSQPAHPEIRVSRILEKGTFSLFDSAYLHQPDPSLFDTIRLSFTLVNDLPVDTTIYLYEGLNEWFRFEARPRNDSIAGYVSVSGRKFYHIIPYAYRDFPALPYVIRAGAAYTCTITYRGTAYRKASKQIFFVSPVMFKKYLADEQQFEYTNHIITYFYIGALAFGFFFFFFLFSKSKYRLFGLYALFLFIHALYGYIQVDVHSGIGTFMRTRAHWDDYVNEVLVFLGQAVYVQFMILWLGVKATNPRAYQFLRVIGFFFLAYAVSFLVLYNINPNAHVLYEMEKWIRLTAIGIQLAVFYLLIFKVRSPVKLYVLAGTFLVILFGVGFVAMSRAGWFKHTLVEDFDYGSWYMIGILFECMCFASGLGLRYFLIDQSNLRLQQENIKVLEDKLAAEQEARENESKLADLNQELTNQQLTALRAQMNPHFIFNALNSIQKYIVTGSVDEANSYLSKFSRLQRMILSYSDQNFITLDKEVEILKLYLELEQLRLTNEFHFDIVLDDEIEPEEIRIPPMILQPFAENAIWHGLIPKLGEKIIHIEFILTGPDTLKCIVEDNGIGRNAAQKIKDKKVADQTINKSRGMSLVHNRLGLLEKKYGKTFSVKILDMENGQHQPTGTRIEIDIPIDE